MIQRCLCARHPLAPPKLVYGSPQNSESSRLHAEDPSPSLRDEPPAPKPALSAESPQQPREASTIVPILQLRKRDLQGRGARSYCSEPSGRAESQTRVSDEIPCTSDRPHLPRLLSLMHLRGCREHLRCAERCARLCGTWQKPRCLTSGCLPKETHRASAPTPSQNRTNLRSCQRGRGQTELRTPAERGFDSTSPNPESALFQQNLLPQGPLQPGPAFPSQRASGQAAVSQRETCASLAACWDLGTEAPSIRVREQSRQREPSPPRPFRGGLEK